jgi:hypothetical protein
MDLPLRFVEEASDEPVISVDGAWGAPGLNLSHWPGNRTPPELAHDLSTGSALAFARLPAARRAELAQGCVAVAINHYDTDGACALFAVLRPELALAREQKLLDAAAAGDLFAFPSEQAFAIDCIVSAAADPARTPWPAVARAGDDRSRHEAALRELVLHLPEMLDDGLEPYAELWQPELARLREDQAALRSAAKDEIAHLELCVWTAAAREGAFDPGRHALFGSTAADRVLAVGPTSARGTTYRLVIGTRSWFELVSPRPQPRPDLPKLAAELDALEGSAPEDEHAWRSQPIASPSPELWFGTREHPWFAEHAGFAERAGALHPSRLAPAVVRRAVLSSLRSCWSFPC